MGIFTQSFLFFCGPMLKSNHWIRANTKDANSQAHPGPEYSDRPQKKRRV